MATYSYGPIEGAEFGRFVIDGVEHGQDAKDRIGVGKDIRLIGREVTRWAERKGHELEPDMITGIYGRGLDTLVIGIGWESGVHCPGKVMRAIRAGGIPTIVTSPTPEACAIYNLLHREGRKVALLAHGTC